MRRALSRRAYSRSGQAFREIPSLIEEPIEHSAPRRRVAQEVSRASAAFNYLARESNASRGLRIHLFPFVEIDVRWRKLVCQIAL